MSKIALKLRATDRSYLSKIALKSRAGDRAEFGPCVAHKNRGMARNERLVSLAGNLFWLTFFCHEKLHHFACTEVVSFIILESVSCAVCNFARAVAYVKIAMLSALRKLILSPELIR